LPAFSIPLLIESAPYKEEFFFSQAVFFFLHLRKFIFPRDLFDGTGPSKETMSGATTLFRDDPPRGCHVLLSLTGGSIRCSSPLLSLSPRFSTTNGDRQPPHPIRASPLLDQVAPFSFSQTTAQFRPCSCCFPYHDHVPRSLLATRPFSIARFFIPPTLVCFTSSVSSSLFPSPFESGFGIPLLFSPGSGS